MLNRKRISIICLCIGIFVILIIGLAIAGSMNNEQQKFKEDNQINNEELEKQLFNEKNSEENDSIKEEPKEQQKIEEKKFEEETMKEESKENVSNSNSSANNQVKNNSQNNQTQSQNNYNKSQQTTANNSTQNNSAASNIKQPWDELGISESDFYNKPIWSYATVNFKVENYPSRAETEAACQKESMRLFNEEEKASSCTSINSYSGRYLGEWLKVE